jgi:hypothetical protein
MLKDGNASDNTNHLVATASHFLGFKLWAILESVLL